MHRTAANLLPPVNEVWGKVIFSQASVILFTGKLGIGFPACITGHMTREAGMPPGGVCIREGVCWADSPHPSDKWDTEIRSRNGWYVSYWKAFLFQSCIWFLEILTLQTPLLNRFIATETHFNRRREATEMFVGDFHTLIISLRKTQL